MDKTKYIYLSEAKYNVLKVITSFIEQQNYSPTNKEVAMNLGFEETSYFIRVFRIQTQTTPQVFRNKNQGKKKFSLN